MTELESAKARLTELQECYEIVLKTARRCARDLGHAISHIPTECEFREMYVGRLQHYRTVLDDLADYRIRVLTRLDHLESENESLRRQLALKSPMEEKHESSSDGADQACF